MPFRSFAKNPTRQSIGYLELKDARAGIKWIMEKMPDARLGLIGASLGATTALRIATEFPGIVCVCADCPFATLPSVVTQKVASVFYILPPTIVDCIVNVADRLNILLYKYSMSEVSAIHAVSDPRFTFPLYIIHCEHDIICPQREGEMIFEAAVHSESREIWRVPDTKHRHLETAYRAPAEYCKRVVTFFDDCYENIERIENGRTEEGQLDEGVNANNETDSPGFLSYINPVAYIWTEGKPSQNP